MNRNGSLIMVACAALVCGCAATVPNELAAARRAYEQASAGPAAQLAPAELHKARTALDLAEQAFAQDADSYQTRDLAYVAERKAQMAVVHASIGVAQESRTRSDSDFQSEQGSILQETMQDLNETRTALAVSEQAGLATAQQLVAEQDARRDAAQKEAAEATPPPADAQELSRVQTALAVSEYAGQVSTDRLAVEQLARIEAEQAAAAQGLLVQEKTRELSQARTALAASEQAGLETAAQLAARQEVDRKAEWMASLETEPSTAVPDSTPEFADARTTLAVSEYADRVATDRLAVEQEARLSAEQAAAAQGLMVQETTRELTETRTALAVSEYAEQVGTDRLALEQKARIEAEQRTQSELEQKTAAQSLLMQRSTQDLSQARAALAASEQAGLETAAQLAAEQKGRLAAEQKTTAAEALTTVAEAKTAAAEAALAELSATREDERGTIITLSGGVLFRSNEATLMPGAAAQLDQVAAALGTDISRNVVVEGYTDSQGSTAYNLVLSQRRADAVRDYLVHRGYPAARLQATGIGEGHPIADNMTNAGRANNRRVEIVVEREATP